MFTALQRALFVGITSCPMKAIASQGQDQITFCSTMSLCCKKEGSNTSDCAAGNYNANGVNTGNGNGNNNVGLVNGIGNGNYNAAGVTNVGESLSMC